MVNFNGEILPESSQLLIVHEENIEITETGARYLSPKVNKELPVI